MVGFAEYNEGNFSLPTHILHNIRTKPYSYVNLAFSENGRHGPKTRSRSIEVK
jgi:hypothetical protein